MGLTVCVMLSVRLYVNTGQDSPAGQLAVCGSEFTHPRFARGNVLIQHEARFFGRLVNNPLEPGRDENLSYGLGKHHWARCPGCSLQIVSQPFFHRVRRCTHPLQQFWHDALRLFEERQEKMLDIHLAVAVALHDLVCAHGGVLSALSGIVI